VNTRQSLDFTAISAMVVICAVLGFQQVALKFSSADMAPILQLAVRSGIAAILVAVLMRVRHDSFSLSDGTLLPGLGLGVLFTLEYLCLGEGLRFTSASRMVVFLYTAPIFSALLLHFLRKDERLRLTQWCGILLAFIGVSITFTFSVSPTELASDRMWWGDLLGLLGGFIWGMSTVLVRTSALASAPAAKTLFYQLSIASCLLLVLAIFLKQSTFSLTPYLISNLLFQGVVISFLSFLAWFALLKRYIASELGVLMFMSPIFGVAFGVILLSEPLESRFVIGCILVLLGILLVTADQRFIKKQSA
jgi:drug/metabolite transporter (DMT)-like permease